MPPPAAPKRAVVCMACPWMLFAVLGGVACAGASSPDAGAGPAEDAGGPVIECNPNLPPASAPCLEGQCGNSLGVGQPCTRGGNECGDLPFGTHASLCTADFSDTDLHYCTKACTQDDQCGENAFCAIDPDDVSAGAGCLIEACR